MEFEITNKVAIVTGGASGVGLEFCKGLLRHHCKGVTIADVNYDVGVQVLEILQNEFGCDRIIFVQTDVSKFSQFEDAFMKTIEKFGNVDILINSASIKDEALWEKEIMINVKGTVNGMILGLEKYLPKHNEGSGGLIVNITSLIGIKGSSSLPVYCATQHAIIGLTRVWGIPEFMENMKVKVIGICPDYRQIEKRQYEAVARNGMEIIKYAANGTVWFFEEEGNPCEYIFPHRRTMKDNLLNQN